MRRIDLAYDKGCGAFNYQGESFQRLAVLLESAAKKNLICREDGTKSRCKVELFVPFGLCGQDGLARFQLLQSSAELVVSMLDVSKFGNSVWSETVSCLSGIAADSGCARVIFKCDASSGDMCNGCEPDGAAKRPDSSWVIELR